MLERRRHCQCMFPATASEGFIWQCDCGLHWRFKRCVGTGFRWTAISHWRAHRLLRRSLEGALEWQAKGGFLLAFQNRPVNNFHCSNRNCHVVHQVH